MQKDLDVRYLCGIDGQPGKFHLIRYRQAVHRPTHGTFLYWSASKSPTGKDFLVVSDHGISSMHNIVLSLFGLFAFAIDNSYEFPESFRPTGAGFIDPRLGVRFEGKLPDYNTPEELRPIILKAIGLTPGA